VELPKAALGARHDVRKSNGEMIFAGSKSLPVREDAIHLLIRHQSHQKYQTPSGQGEI
tara:strand:- start:26993 stop:27166 length:174 start_codon:yes stop_codon:yes gene_type:complete